MFQKYLEVAMLIKISTLSIVIILCCHTWGIASEHDNGASEFLKEFIKAEYIGNQSFRVDNTMYSPERKLMIKGMYGPLRGEIFYWESAMLCVVDDYKITSINLIKSKATIDVTFNEFGCTGSKGYGDVPIIKTNKISVVRYYLKYKRSRWWLCDPPVPRVSRNALITYNDEIIKRMNDFVHEKGTEVQKEYYNSLINTNNMLKEKN